MEHKSLSKKRVVAIGGGTGNFTVLNGLKRHFENVTTVVSMSDEGGSTGLLREEFGIGDLERGPDRPKFRVVLTRRRQTLIQRHRNRDRCHCEGADRRERPKQSVTPMRWQIASCHACVYAWYGPSR